MMRQKLSSPASGTTTDSYEFSILSRSSNTPTALKLVFDGQQFDMQANGSSWSKGVKYTITRSGLTIGQHSFYFTGTLDGKQVRYPDGSTMLTLGVAQSQVGWDLMASDVRAVMPKPGQTFNVACDAWNNSNSSD